jgi:hypothetical protein
MFNVLNLYDFGPHIRQDFSSKRARQTVGEVEDFNSLKHLERPSF